MPAEFPPLQSDGMSDDASPHGAAFSGRLESSASEQSSPQSEHAMFRGACRWLREIEFDVRRTYPLQDAALGSPVPGRTAALRVLVAYAEHNPDVGYCQGMNLFVWVALLVSQDEEEAFWCFCGIIDKLFGRYFSRCLRDKGADPLLTDGRILEALADRFCPKVAEHLRAVGASLQCVAPAWLASGLLDCMPLRSVLRVWDVMLYERSTSILFRACLAVLDIRAKELLSTKDASDAYLCLKASMEGMQDASLLLIIACNKFVRINEEYLSGMRAEEAFGGQHTEGPVLKKLSDSRLLRLFLCDGICH